MTSPARFLAPLILFSFCGLALAKAPAKQNPDKEAQANFKQGIALYEEGKYEQAAIAFARAYELKPSYKLLYNIGQVENQLEHYAAAFTAYRRYLDEGGDDIKAARRAEVEAEVERLEALVGYIEVTSPIEGAKVKIDNEVVGATPLPGPLLVDMGRHEVAVHDADVQILLEVVKVAGGQTVTIDAQVKKATEEPSPAVVVAPAPIEKPRRVWTWVAGGIGVAAGIAAAVTGGVASSKSKDLEDGCAGNECPPSQWDSLDSARNLATTTDVLIGVAAAGVATGVVLFFLEPRIGEREEPTVTPVVTDETAFVSVTGRF